MEASDSFDRDRRFVDLLTSHQRDLYVYTHALMAGDSATADVVQDANVELWAHKEEYDSTRPFLPWALRFAYHRVLAYRKTRSRSRLLLSDEFVSSLAESMQRSPLDADGRLAALTRCMENLPDEQRKLLRDRYTCGVSVKGLATRLNASADQISSRLYRLRKDLGQCIKRRMAAEGSR